MITIDILHLMTLGNPRESAESYFEISKGTDHNVPPQTVAVTWNWLRRCTLIT